MLSSLVLSCLPLLLIANPTHHGVDLEPLLTLLHAKEKNCTEVNWCTLSGKSDGTNAETRCCRPCLCDPACKNNNTCCPDFELSRLLDGQQFDNVSDVEKALLQFTPDDFANYAEDLYGSDVVSGPEGSRCIPVSVLPYSPYRPDIPSAWVIVQCLDSEIHANSQTKRLCEEHQDNSLNATLVSRYTPVQSRTSGYVYRNIYCLECSTESTSEYTVWEAFIAITMAQFSRRPVTVETLEELFKNVNTWFYSMTMETEIIFKPPISQYSYTLQPQFCSKIDVTSCDNRSEYTRSFTEACARYTDPVNVYMSGWPIRYFEVFNNIACVQCNAVSRKERCLGNHITAADVTKIFTSRIRITDDRDSLGGSNGGTLAKVFDQSNNCEPGFVYDEKKNICRKVYCPRHFFIDGDQCKPLFEPFEGVVYSVPFDVTGDNDTINATMDIYNFITEYFNSYDEVHLLYSSLYQSFNGQPMVYMEYTHHVTNSGAPGAESVLLNFMNDRVLSSKGLSLSLANIEKTSKGFMWINKETQITYKQIYPVTNQKRKRKQTYRFLKEDLCYRLQLEQEEFLRSGKNVMLKTDTGYQIINNNVLYSDVIARPLVCADQVIDARDLPLYIPPESRGIMADTETFSDFVDTFIDYGVPSLVAMFFIFSLFIICIIRNKNISNSNVRS